MKKYWFIEYSDGYGHHEEEIVSFDSKEEALDYAYDSALSLYEDYAGMHGVPDREEIAEEYDLDDIDEIEEAYEDHIEDSIEYSAREATREDFENFCMDIPEDFE